MKPRDSVQWFATKMESVLRDNDHKTGWSDMELIWLFERMGDEWAELEVFLQDSDGFKSDCRKDIINQCADIANFAMMIADNVAIPGD